VLAVVVDSVADLRCARIDGGIGVVTVVAGEAAVTVAVAFVRGDGGPAGSAAVVIDAVADLRRAGIDGGVGVVAVGALRASVAIGVGLVGGDGGQPGALRCRLGDR
jgi:hypothetical protein